MFKSSGCSCSSICRSGPKVLLVGPRLEFSHLPLCHALGGTPSSLPLTINGPGWAFLGGWALSQRQSFSSARYGVFHEPRVWEAYFLEFPVHLISQCLPHSLGWFLPIVLNVSPGGDGYILLTLEKIQAPRYKKAL